MDHRFINLASLSPRFTLDFGAVSGSFFLQN
jgi:hypothetical protein